MNIHTVCADHALVSVLIYLCATKLYYIFNHHQKLRSAYVKPHIFNKMASLQRIYNFKINSSPCVAAELQRLWFFSLLFSFNTWPNYQTFERVFAYKYLVCYLHLQINRLQLHTSS